MSVLNIARCGALAFTSILVSLTPPAHADEQSDCKGWSFSDDDHGMPDRWFGDVAAASEMFLQPGTPKPDVWIYARAGWGPAHDLSDEYYARFERVRDNRSPRSKQPRWRAHLIRPVAKTFAEQLYYIYPFETIARRYCEIRPSMTLKEWVVVREKMMPTRDVALKQLKVERLVADSDTCPQILARLEKLEAPLPIDLLGVGDHDEPESYVLDGPARPQIGIAATDVTITLDAYNPIPLHTWARETLKAIEPCWQPEAGAGDDSVRDGR